MVVAWRDWQQQQRQHQWRHMASSVAAYERSSVNIMAAAMAYGSSSINSGNSGEKEK